MWYFQVLKCEDLLLFLVLHYSKLNILGFWTVGRTNKTCDEVTLGCRIL